MKKYIYSDRIYTQRGCISGTIELEGSKILQIHHGKVAAETGAEVFDYGSLRVIPGMIEMHLHGYMGWNAMSPDPEEIVALSKSLLTCGVTGYLPTNHYSHTVFENNKAIAKVMQTARQGARIFGIHMEGPFTSLEKLGSVVPDEVLPVSIELMQKYIETSENHIKTVTMAPEIPNAEELISFLVRRQINVCMGHSNATYAEAKKAIDLGAIITQKTGNCMRGMHHREMGLLGAAVLDQRLFNEINSDIAHTSKEFLELIYRLKGPQKLCIVADSGVMSGMPKGEYELPDRGTYRVGPDALLHIADWTIDGSIYSMLYGLHNWVEVMGIPMEEAVVMASLNPAKVLKIDHQKGSIVEGKDADLVVLDADYKVMATFVEGNLEYTNESQQVFWNEKALEYMVKAFD